MNEKYINFDINDPRASSIAEVMSNKTSKKILSYIAEKEMSESDISSELGLPLNTVGYNIDKLLKAGLIEKSGNFFWSIKGKKILTYRISNKKIVISPKSVFGGVLPALVISVIGAVIIGFSRIGQNAGDNFSQVGSVAVQKTVSNVNVPDIASTAVVVAGNMANSIQQVSIATNYSWVWFLLGALIAVFVVLIFNWRKIR